MMRRQWCLLNPNDGLFLRQRRPSILGRSRGGRAGRMARAVADYVLWLLAQAGQDAAQPAFAQLLHQRLHLTMLAQELVDVLYART